MYTYTHVYFIMYSAGTLRSFNAITIIKMCLKLEMETLKLLIFILSELSS